MSDSATGVGLGSQLSRFKVWTTVRCLSFVNMTIKALTWFVLRLTMACDTL